MKHNNERVTCKSFSEGHRQKKRENKKSVNVYVEAALVLLCVQSYMHDDMP